MWTTREVWEISSSSRYSDAFAVRQRLYQYWLCTLHGTAFRSGKRAVGAVAREETRMWDSHSGGIRAKITFCGISPTE